MIHAVKSTWIACTVLAVFGASAQNPKFELPEGAAAELVLQCDSAQARTTPFRAWPDGIEASGWERVEPWMEWAKLVRAEAESEFPKPLRRAELARIAAATGRHEDAWTHFENCASDPSVAAALLPYLFPGIPLDTHPGAELQSGITLRPLLPPPTTKNLAYGSFDPASLSVTNLKVGEALLSLKLDLSRDGVQIDVTHLSGGPTRLALVMARPEGYYTKTEFLDWERLEDRQTARAIRASADSEVETEHSYWGRFSPLKQGWPGIQNADSTQILERLRRAGIVIQAAPDLEARACGLAFGIEHVFGIPTSEGTLRSGANEPALQPLVLRLSEESGMDGLRVVMGMVEQVAFDQ
ncbi:MAG: hypothetical protein ACI8TQ_003384 [Planctomycetota bacterium]|jgi:hypothetical protein